MEMCDCECIDPNSCVAIFRQLKYGVTNIVDDLTIVKDEGGNVYWIK